MERKIKERREDGWKEKYGSKGRERGQKTRERHKENKRYKTKIIEETIETE